MAAIKLSLIRMALLLLWVIAATAPAEDNFFLGLPYGSHAAQRLNLYLPAGQDKAAPLLIYLPGGFWGPLDERFRTLADGSSKLRFEGTAVAIVQTRSASDASWPAPMQDVAAAMALLKREARRHRIDTRRIFLVGHSSGGFAASRIPFDRDTLGAFGLAAADIAGVITLSGLHDLGGPARQGRVAEFIDAAFKEPPSAAMPGTNYPRSLILVGERDLDGFARDAQVFALRLHGAGARVIHQIVPGANHQSLANLGAEENALTRDLVLEFIGVKQLDEALRLLVDADQHLFFSPPRSSVSFWSQYGGLIRPYPADDRFHQFLFAHILEHRYQLAAMPLKTYHAIPVAELIKTLSGKGQWLRTVNTRNESYYWPLQELIQLDAAIVVGIDDEQNLFRFGVPYRTKREHSWVDHTESRPSVYRGLGGMLYLRKALPAHLALRFTADMSLTADSFSLVEDSPLQAFPNLPDMLKPVLTYTNGCLSCHTLRGVGSLAHHNRIEDGAKQGGLGLPLEDYPPEVWKRFVFQQALAASMVGVKTNLIAEPARQPLFELVNKAREERSVTGTRSQ